MLIKLAIVQRLDKRTSENAHKISKEKKVEKVCTGQKKIVDARACSYKPEPEPEPQKKTLKKCPKFAQY